MLSSVSGIAYEIKISGCSVSSRDQFNDYNAQFPRGLDDRRGAACLNHQGFRPEIFQIKLEFILLVCRIEGCRGCNCGDRHKGRCYFRSVWQDNRNPVIATDSDDIE
jgi:hypothetical protein